MSRSGRVPDASNEPSCCMRTEFLVGMVARGDSTSATRWLAIAIYPPQAIAPSEKHRFPVLVGSRLPCPLPVHQVALGDLDRGPFFWVVRSRSYERLLVRLQRRQTARRSNRLVGWDRTCGRGSGRSDGQAYKVPHDVGDDVVAIEIPTDFSIERIFADISQRTFIPRAGSEEPKRSNGPRIIDRKNISCQLLLTI